MRSFPICRFNESGVEKFRQLMLVETASSDQFSSDFFTSKEYVELVDDRINVEPETFNSKSKLVQYLDSIISEISLKNKYFDYGLWTWLSVVFIDSLCPMDSNSIRKWGAVDRYILNLDHWGRYNRHLLAAPVRLYRDVSEYSDFIFSGPPYKHGDLFEQLVSRQEYATSLGVIEAAKLLYWDQDKLRVKIKARDKKGPGILRRFVKDILPQFEMTYDLNSLTGSEILELLPSEFDRWRQA